MLDFIEFQSAVSHSFVPLRVSTDSADRFRGLLRAATSDEVQICEVTASPHTVERTCELIARDGVRCFKLSLQLQGSALLVQDNRETVLRPGDLAVYDTNRPYSLVFDDPIRTLVMMFPQRLIDLPPDLVGQLTAVRMTGSSGVGGMIAPFLAQLGSHIEQLSGHTGERLVHSALDLVTTMFASELDVRRLGEHPHHELMQRIFDYIDANLGSLDLDPTQIAAAHFISTRHLHSLFHERGATVSSYIRARRLKNCRRGLMDPLYLDRSVASIAARWGFVDAAHFSRVFKTAYGESPSDVRARTHEATAGAARV
ncbi:helix-turn-helix domain-containing protein [Subtercola sp. YIM 133946]|uniref:AraC-like ligand-binding domain-containing protein n=1 Tax=Subtercola sp. YIM 133946 TaxID=3118909 RepID=UPI002F9293DD